MKDKVRPIVTMPSSKGNWYISKTGNGKPFELDKALNRAELRRKGLKRVTKGIKFYNQGRKKWDYIPYVGKRDKTKQIFEIPYAGLAKDGWKRAMQTFDEKKRQFDSVENKKVRNIHKSELRIKLLDAEAVNRVRYASKTSATSARYGLNKATNRIWKTQSKNLERAIERRYNKVTG